MSVDLLVQLYDVLRVKVYEVGLSLNLGFSPMLKVDVFCYMFLRI